jgi:hypothetical protein
MKLFSAIAAAALVVVTTAQAQDTKVKSDTKIKADDAQLATMSGCLRQDAATGDYSIIGTMVAGDELRTKTKTKVDVDRHDTTVSTKSKTKADDGAVVSTYLLVPRANVNLAPHVGHEVQISALTVEPGHGDADVKIKNKTTVDPEQGRDRTTRSTTKVEVPQAGSRYTVVSVKMISPSCSAAR